MVGGGASPISNSDTCIKHKMQLLENILIFVTMQCTIPVIADIRIHVPPTVQCYSNGLYSWNEVPGSYRVSVVNTRQTMH